MIEKKKEDLNPPVRDFEKERLFLLEVANFWKNLINKIAAELEKECNKKYPNESKIEKLRLNIDFMLKKGIWEQKHLEKWGKEREQILWKNLKNKFKNKGNSDAQNDQ